MLSLEVLLDFGEMSIRDALPCTKNVSLFRETKVAYNVVPEFAISILLTLITEGVKFNEYLLVVTNYRISIIMLSYIPGIKSYIIYYAL